MLGGPCRRLVAYLPRVSFEVFGPDGMRSGWNQGAKREQGAIYVCACVDQWAISKETSVFDH